MSMQSAARALMSRSLVLDAWHVCPATLPRMHWLCLVACGMLHACTHHSSRQGEAAPTERPSGAPAGAAGALGASSWAGSPFRVMRMGT